jgi:diguanylate cyclase (GGDEF)-like protein
MSEKEDKPQHERTMQIDRFGLVEQMRGEVEKKPCFIVIGGLDVGSVIHLEEPVITMGRDAKCGVVLRDDGVSRFHAEVRRKEPGQVIIRDLDSTNGTFVAGQRIKEAVLSDGDKVLIGRRTILKFTFQDEIEYNYQKQIYESSTRDGLTGVYNRKYFSKKIVSDLSFARRHRVPCTLAMFDIDHFKKVNDTYGHRTGDRVLISVTRAVKQMIRTEDTFARYGGEEFIVIALGTDFEGGKTLGERIRACVAQQQIQAVDGSQSILQVTSSVGVITAPPDANVEPSALVSAVDANLYEAKRRGRNNVVVSLI